MSCDNCFNGCVDTTSDKCVKYTGIDYPSLNIQNGDSLAAIEDSIITVLLDVINGSGIKFTIPTSVLCTLVNSYLPITGDITIVDYVTALIKSACELQTQITDNTNKINTIEANYNIECLSGVTATSGTHSIVQAVITKLCTTSSTLASFISDVQTNYVKISEINTYIANYISSAPASTAIRTRMVPNTVVEYYGSLSNFNASGAGIGDWEQIYLCNGQNNTPDKRGRSPIGVVTGMGGGAYNPSVDPSNPSNPNYTILSAGGSNTVTLNAQQMPAHSHSATATVTELPHFHTINGSMKNAAGGGSEITLNPGSAAAVPTNTATTGITVNVVNAPAGDSQAHPNVHPVLACYYIMYIPNP
jgi:microcystin-dependent protein